MKTAELKQKFHTLTHQTKIGSDGEPRESIAKRVYAAGFGVACVAAAVYGLHTVDDSNKAGIRDSLNVQIGQKILHADIIDPDQKLDSSYTESTHEVIVNRIGESPCIARFQVYRGGDHAKLTKNTLNRFVPNRAVIIDPNTCEPSDLVQKQDHDAPGRIDLPSTQPSFR